MKGPSRAQYRFLHWGTHTHTRGRLDGAATQNYCLHAMAHPPPHPPRSATHSCMQRWQNVWCKVLVFEQLWTMVTSSAEGHVTTVAMAVAFYLQSNYGYSAIISILRSRLEWCSLCNVKYSSIQKAHVHNSMCWGHTCCRGTLPHATSSTPTHQRQDDLLYTSTCTPHNTKT